MKIRRTVDFKWLNAHIDPHVFHCEPPIRQAMKIPLSNWKTVLDARDGFHSVPLAEESKKWTHFITKHGKYAYERLPQGVVSAPAAFSERMAEAEKGPGGRQPSPNQHDSWMMHASGRKKSDRCSKTQQDT